MKLLANRDGVLLVAIVSLSTTLRLAFVWSGAAEGALLSDDAYYYFTIARNVAAGDGPTFDGLSPTNGFHPLWMLLLVPVFKLFDSDLWTPVRVAGTLIVLFDLVSAWILFRMFDANRMRRAALSAVAIWLVFPFTVLLGMRGMEASLSTLTVLVLLMFLLRVSFSRRSMMVAGVLIGITGLARADNLVATGIATAAFVLVAAGNTRPNGKAGAARGPGSFGARATLIAVAGFSALVVAAPWLIWNELHFGGIIPVSGQVKFQRPDIYGALPIAWSGVVPAVKSLAYQFFAPVVVPARFLTGEEFVPARVAPAVVAFILASVAAAAWRTRTTLRDSDLTRGIVVFAAAFVLVQVILYGFVWRAYMSWYALPVFAQLTAIVALATERIRRIGVATILFAAFSVGLYAQFLTRLSHSARGPELLYGARVAAVADRCPSGCVLGVYDAGAVGYLSGNYPGVTVTNLDCLVNNTAFRAVQSGSFGDYVLETVDVLFEPPSWASMYLDSLEVDAFAAHFERHESLDLWFKR